MQLSQLQQKIINSPDSRIVVTAAAAAGKTTIMTEKVRQLLRAGVNPRQIAVITFTNMAAGTLRARLGDDYKDGLFVGTIHALANYMLCSSGFDTSKILNKEKFDELFEMVKDHPSCVKKMEWILLDEAQDSDESQFHFLFEMIDPPNFFVVGDPRQSIYGFKGSDPTLMMSLNRSHGATILSLNENYRNGSNILSYARRLISSTGLYDDSVAMRMYPGVVTEALLDLKTIKPRIYEDPMPEFKNWAILCRTNDEISQVIFQLKKDNIPFDTFRQGDLTNAELDKKMESQTVKVLTIHSSKGLEWDNVIMLGGRFYSPEEYRVCYVGVTRARNQLIWMRAPKRQRQQLRSW